MNVLEQARADHARLSGKILAVAGAQIGHPEHGRAYRFLEFAEAFPLLVVVTGSFDVKSSVRYWSADFMDTYYDVVALPHQLAGGEYVSWIYGPSYEDGKTFQPCVIDHPCAAWLNGMAARDRAEFLEVLAESRELAGDWIEDHDGAREWELLFALKVVPHKEE